MPKRSTASSMMITPPVKGWNTRDPISAMDPDYALECVNFFPAFGTVDLRQGQTLQVTASGNNAFFGTFKSGTVDALLVSNFSGGILSIVPGSSPGTSIAGAVTTTGFFTYFQQFKDRVFMTTDFGLDHIYTWTGTGTIAASGFTGPGGDDMLLGPMASYKNRIYFAHRAAFSSGIPRNGNLEIWYPPGANGVAAITGALAKFDLSTIFRLGGYISFIGSVTRAKDFSEEELFAIVSSEGEILVYSGDSPDSNNWGILGHYFIPKPCSPKSLYYVGSNLVIVTRQGVFGMDAIMAGGFGGSSSDSILNNSLDDVIKSAFVNAVIAADSAIFGYDDLIWSGIYYPRGNYLLINIPLTNITSEQYVMNTVTGAWCRFTNQNAYSWIVYQDRLYYCNPNHTKIYRADDGNIDADQISGTSKPIKLRFAQNYFGDTELVKQFTEARPLIYQDQGFQLSMSVDVDYANDVATQQVTPDNSDLTYKLYRPKVGLQGLGKSASIRIDGSVTSKKMSLQAVEVFWNDGDITA